VPHDFPPESPWAAYSPDKAAPWDLRRVVHLRRRAGFAATWDELQRDLKDGPTRSIDRLLSGKARTNGVPDDFEAGAAQLGEDAESAREPGLIKGEPIRLKGWWVYRMVFGPDPLTERLTLMWHNHFATSVEKVRDISLMRRQNETFRRQARAPFGELLYAAAREPALLVWLDAPSNRKGHPNENLARELMELFALGVGRFAEMDVKEGARALTGWTVAGRQFREDAALHDDGEKDLLGRKGRWKGDDYVRLLLEHPATAERLAWRLCDTLLGEGAVGQEALKVLAGGLRQRGLDVAWGVETMLRSKAFFAAANLGTRAAAPAEYVGGAARALELFDPSPSTVLLSDCSARLGQDLFAPPNVGGWPGGRAWVSGQAAIARANYAAALVAGRLSRGGQPLDALALAHKHGRGKDLDDLLNFFGELLCGAAPGSAWRDRVSAGLGPKPALTAESARRATALMLASPEMQLA
jgi:uncharacterized protein (DUF1800 family)